MKSTIRKWGNSLALRIPKSFAEEAHVAEGVDVDLRIHNGQLVVVPQRRAPTLKTLLSRVTRENLHSETETGDPEGLESW